MRELDLENRKMAPPIASSTPRYSKELHVISSDLEQQQQLRHCAVVR